MIFFFEGKTIAKAFNENVVNVDASFSINHDSYASNDDHSNFEFDKLIYGYNNTSSDCI